jgi:hypothetical protein
VPPVGAGLPPVMYERLELRVIVVDDRAGTA